MICVVAVKSIDYGSCSHPHPHNTPKPIDFTAIYNQFRKMAPDES